MITLYDWTVKGKVEGKGCDEDESRSGKLEIKNFSFENSVDEVEVRLSKFVFFYIIIILL